MTSRIGLSRRGLLGAAALALSAGFGLPALGQAPLAVAGIWTVPVQQQWASRIHQALLAAEQRGEIDYVFTENVANTDYARVMREHAERGVGLIVGEAFGVEQPSRAVAAEYPEVKFLMGSSLPPVRPNYAVFDNYIQEASYLTGMVAGATTASGIIGLVGGYAIPEVNRLMNAFIAGAMEANPDVRFVIGFINSWYDPPGARQAAFEMIDAGADIVYAERFGVAEAARDRGVLAIGNVIDTSDDYPGTILASALWHGEPMIDKVIADVRAGTFTASDYGIYAHLEHGGSSFVVDDLLADADAVAAALAREEEIRAGTFTVAIDDTVPEATM